MPKANSSFLNYYSWPIAIVIFFVLLAAFNVYLAKQAFNNHPDNVTDSPYESGLKYQEIVDQLTLAKSLGLKANIDIGTVQVNGRRLISVSLHAADPGALTQIKSVLVRAMRPSSASLDVQATLQKKDSSQQNFAGEIQIVTPGYYLLEVSIEMQQGLALLKDSLIVKR